MSWLKKLFGSRASDRSKNDHVPSSAAAIGSREPEQGDPTEHHPGPDAEAPKRQQSPVATLRLVCPACGCQYAVGEDAVIITMDMVTSLMDMSVRLQSADSTADPAKDLISPASDIPLGRRPLALAQAGEMAQAVLASVSAGKKRTWICHRCKTANEYAAHANATTEPTSLSEKESHCGTMLLVLEGCSMFRDARNKGSTASVIAGLLRMSGGKLTPLTDAEFQALWQRTLYQTGDAPEFLSHVGRSLEPNDRRNLLVWCVIALNRVLTSAFTQLKDQQGSAGVTRELVESAARVGQLMGLDTKETARFLYGVLGVLG